ncbi:unnamed protein product [Didymodactylos carnosus]|nr:unnamed protein product [Didymodactylos carnosus]CAF3654539.1 unnamed protein product [Didymodactylos carnosus]
MLEAKRNGVYIDDEEERRKAKEKKKLDDKLELARKLDGSASKKDDDDECIEWENDLNSDLGKLSKEEKNVGWEYRYRIRRKLDDLKRQQPLTPVTTDAPGGKRLKKPITKKPDVDQQQQQLLEDQKKKIVGWKYRYRVSKMLEAQKQEKLDGTTSTKKTLSAKVINDKDKLDPILANLTPEQKEVGWAYRYRIRRKLDETRNATSRTDGGKRLRSKKPSNETTPEPTRTRKRKPKQKMKQIEEQIEKILNIEDIKETPFYEYFFMSYNYVLHELLPALHKSLCQLPIGMPFCDDTDDEVSQQKQEEKPPVQKKKLRTKKEQRAKQFIRTKASRLVSDDDNDKPIDETLKKIMKKATTATTIATPPTSTTTQVPKHDTADASGSSSNTITPKRKKAPHRRKVLIDEQVQHYDEEETPVKKVIGVETKKKNMKKRFHLIGKETKPSRHRNKTKTSIGTSSDIDSGKQSSNTVKSTIDHGVPQTFTNEKVEPPKPPNHLHLKQIITDDQTKTKNTDKTPVESNNNNRESSETTSKTNPTETKVPVRENLKLSDVVDKVKDDVVEKVNNVVEKVNDVGETIIQQPIVETVKKEAEKFLKHPNDDISSKKIAEETNEANEDILENSKLNQQQKTQTNDDEKDQTGNETDSEEESSDDDDNDNSDGEEEEEEDDDDNQKKDKKSEDSQGFLQSPIKKMNKYYENAKESVHDVFDLENDKNEPK